MSGPLRPDDSEVDGPPKRSEVESSPLPVPLGGGVGLAAFGVGAEDDDFDGALISGICCLGMSQVGGSTSIAPSMPVAVDVGCLTGEDS